MNKKLYLSIVGIATSGLILIGANQVFAQGPAGNSNIVQKIAQKFGLNESDVQAVFNENRQQHQAQMEAGFETRLNQAVKDGKLNAEQKAAIFKKHEELQTQRQADRQNWQNLTPEQRRTEAEKRRQEMEAWAKQNNIDLQSFFFGGRGMRGFGWK
ncbi:hypothetical protein A3H86_02475 [Candidatus Roizmanbacteria bacterium RIFCSPLOWO2_02_FULL_41_9]|uniref:DUF2680 domain-containing protein n=1 Tax=Candidatus Roizmanbacteria bacterium RIFCSPLOWO2_02_FULL_41_9 TaxID=1802077 RepID=A0A1F7JRY6_9BACT|nr:MAG: hypothetical protein A3H86_02475 [Candidatus Roizmanbacteria bacterium RIFCSPLOWO2_02_FULL_41_9]